MRLLQYMNRVVLTMRCVNNSACTAGTYVGAIDANGASHDVGSVQNTRSTRCAEDTTSTVNPRNHWQHTTIQHAVNT